jgi:hypothetical protein
MFQLSVHQSHNYIIKHLGNNTEYPYNLHFNTTAHFDICNDSDCVLSGFAVVPKCTTAHRGVRDLESTSRMKTLTTKTATYVDCINDEGEMEQIKLSLFRMN